MPTLFELHLTTTELDEIQLSRFVSFCGTIEAKPILIELPEGRQRQQPMISKVVRCEDPSDIHPILDSLKQSFKQAGFPVKRIKVEVPPEHRREAETAFPDFLGGYYEWHGKVKVTDTEKLLKLCRLTGAHLSANALKDRPGERFVTVRGTANERGFRYKVTELTKNLAKNNFPLLKEEAEYCVFDSNKSPDIGWIHTSGITNTERANQFAFDGFLRRAAIVNGPFMLKGSLVTRQYLQERGEREAQDLDFVYLGEADESEAVEATFTKWVIAVTETEMDDGIHFPSFSENSFWRGIDYAMDDDFPTTCTDIYCEVDKQDHIIDLDISWNLMSIFPVKDYAPVSLNYHPARGNSFVIPSTVPLSLQISWKLHQMVVRPRRKDMEDLIMLFEQAPINLSVIRLALKAFKFECQRDKVSYNKLNPFLTGIYSFDSSLDNLHNSSYPSRGWTTEKILLAAFVVAAHDVGLTEAFGLRAPKKNSPSSGHKSVSTVSPSLENDQPTANESWWQQFLRRLKI